MLDGGAFGRHGAAGVRRQGHPPPVAAGQDGGRRDPSWGDGDELPFAAFAQLLQSAALQAELVPLWTGTVLWKVELRQVAPSVQVLKEDVSLLYSFLSNHAISST